LDWCGSKPTDLAKAKVDDKPLIAAIWQLIKEFYSQIVAIDQYSSPQCNAALAYTNLYVHDLGLKMVKLEHLPSIMFFK
jgi:hypothetical protein